MVTSDLGPFSSASRLADGQQRVWFEVVGATSEVVLAGRLGQR